MSPSVATPLSLSALRERLERRSHALIVVAEGAGQDLMAKSQEQDASGNVKYGDIGVFLSDAIKGHFKPNHHFGFEAAAWYWHFVDVVWLFLFVAVYIWGAGSAEYAAH